MFAFDGLLFSGDCFKNFDEVFAVVVVTERKKDGSFFGDWAEQFFEICIVTRFSGEPGKVSGDSYTIRQGGDDAGNNFFKILVRIEPAIVVINIFGYMSVG